MSEGLLGMGSGAIPDASITSSSEEVGSEAYRGRINPDSKHGAWCPEVAVDMNTYQWIQVRMYRSAGSAQSW